MFYNLFSSRFSHLFVDIDLLMATAVHPQHNLATVRAICKRRKNETIYDQVRDKLFKELRPTWQTPEPFSPVSTPTLLEQHRLPVCHGGGTAGAEPWGKGQRRGNELVKKATKG